jgi:hypothetical protein
MPLFAVGVLVGIAFAIFVYHVRILRDLRKWGHDWRARAISAEQEVENWKNFVRSQGLRDPFR